MDAEILARIQFALSIACHILFPVITIGLAWFLSLAALSERRDASGAWAAQYRFWVRIFALSFVFGIATGLIQGLQLVTSFGPFQQIAAPVLGRLRWA